MSRAAIYMGSRTTRERRLEHGDRRADGHQPGETQNVRVLHPDAAVRDGAWQELRLVGPVDADVAAAGPAGQVRSASARAERDRAVHRVAEARELHAHVELSAGRREVRTADADGRAQDRL